jgi:L-fucose mutarotase
MSSVVEPTRGVVPGALGGNGCSRASTLDPLLNADLLYALRAMGHGDELVIVDANFPAATMGKRIVRLDGASATQALEAVLSVMPLDEFVDAPCARMQVVDDPGAVPEICNEFQAIIDRAAGDRFKLVKIERFAFYERAQRAFVLVQTGETRLYGNVLLKMGVICPD